MNRRNSPLVSVIINFFNVEKYLNEAVQSVLDQTYSNWELILVDDGSTDSSTSISKKYQIENPGRIFYFDHPGHENKGMSAARNLGIKFSKGEFLTFLDADDKFLPGNLEEQVKIFKGYPDISCVFSATKYWYSWESNKSSDDFIQTLRVPSKVYKPGELFRLFLTKKAAVPSMSLMVKTEFVRSFSGFDEEFKVLFSDQVLYAKILLEGTNFVDNNYYYLYRQHPESYCAKSVQQGTILRHRIKYLQWLQKYLVKKGINDPGMNKIIKRRIWLCRHPAVNYLHRRFIKQKNKLLLFRDNKLKCF